MREHEHPSVGPEVEQLGRLRPEPNSRTRADNAGGRSTTVSPTATSRYTNSDPTPTELSADHGRLEPRSLLVCGSLSGRGGTRTPDPLRVMQVL